MFRDLIMLGEAVFFWAAAIFFVCMGIFLIVPVLMALPIK